MHRYFKSKSYIPERTPPCKRKTTTSPTSFELQHKTARNTSPLHTPKPIQSLKNLCIQILTTTNDEIVITNSFVRYSARQENFSLIPSLRTLSLNSLSLSTAIKPNICNIPACPSKLRPTPYSQLPTSSTPLKPPLRTKLNNSITSIVNYFDKMAQLTNVYRLGPNYN